VSSLNWGGVFTFPLHTGGVKIYLAVKYYSNDGGSCEDGDNDVGDDHDNHDPYNYS